MTPTDQESTRQHAAIEHQTNLIDELNKKMFEGVKGFRDQTVYNSYKQRRPKDSMALFQTVFNELSYKIDVVNEAIMNSEWLEYFVSKSMGQERSSSQMRSRRLAKVMTVAAKGVRQQATNLLGQGNSLVKRKTRQQTQLSQALMPHRNSIPTTSMQYLSYDDRLASVLDNPSRASQIQSFYSTQSAQRGETSKPLQRHRKNSVQVLKTFRAQKGKLLSRKSQSMRPGSLKELTAPSILKNFDKVPDTHDTTFFNSSQEHVPEIPEEKPKEKPRNPQTIEEAANLYGFNFTSYKERRKVNKDIYNQVFFRAETPPPNIQKPTRIIKDGKQVKPMVTIQVQPQEKLQVKHKTMQGFAGRQVEVVLNLAGE